VKKKRVVTKLSLYVVIPDSESIGNIKQSLSNLIGNLPEPEFRMNESPFSLLWWDLLVKNVIKFRGKIKDFQRNFPFLSVYVRLCDEIVTYHECNML